MAAGYQHIFQGTLGLRELSSKDKHHFPLFTITEVTSPEEGVEGAVFYLNITSQDTELVSPKLYPPQACLEIYRNFPGWNWQSYLWYIRLQVSELNTVQLDCQILIKTAV